MYEFNLQIDESAINETFASTNNVFDEFRIFSSSYFYRFLIGLHQFQKIF